MDSLLILGGSKPYAYVSERTRALGMRAVVADRNPKAPAAVVADAFHPVDITDRNGILSVAMDENVSGVLALNDFGVPTAAFVSEQLGLPGISQDAAGVATSKLLMRQAWQTNNVPSADFIRVGEDDDHVRAAESIGYPVIVKPACSIGGGCRGVSLVARPEELKAAVDFAREFYPDKTILIEEYLQGLEFSVEATVWRGRCTILAVGENVKVPAPYRVNKQIVYPAYLAPEDEHAATEAIANAIRALPVENGSVHVEFCLTKGGPKLIELGARCGGGGIAGPVIMSALGINVVDEAIRMSVGRAPILSGPLWHKTSVYHFLTPPPGTVKRITGIEETMQLEGVEEVLLFTGPGSQVRPLRTGLERAGTVISSHADKEEALRIAWQADAMINFEYETETGEVIP